MDVRRAWDGDGWQVFALRLVQLRHKPQNVQLIPDKVRGDAGIEFFSIDGCLYQCYAPEEVANVAKAASAMKAKAARDLQKLVKNQLIIAAILQSVRASRWILLCPFLDNKEVVVFVREKGVVLKQAGLPFIDTGFEALVQSQADFGTELELLRQQSAGTPLEVIIPSHEALLARAVGEVSQRLAEKLQRAFPSAPPLQIEKRKNSYVRAHMIRENALEAMRVDFPILWERSQRCLNAEEDRLVAVGTASTAPRQQLAESLARIEQRLRQDLPNLEGSTITEIAVGTITDWLLRCPLDFPDGGSSK